ncbi:MAG: 4Fe-4S binding protein [Ignavibacteriales bacterium]|nr:4Fe-4S binding protein [Ignavibacteriales bacterium]
MFGVSIGFNLLDPYSNFGRIIGNIIRPISIGSNNLITAVLESLNLYLLSPLEFKRNKYFFIFIFAFNIWINIFLSFYYGRLYCNTICPVGTFLGLISKFSLFKIGIIESNCIECGDCETVCKSSCIESSTKYIDFSRCVGCFNCFDVCPSIGISYQPRYTFSKSLEHSPDKRNFFKNVGVFILGSYLILKAQEKNN